MCNKRWLAWVLCILCLICAGCEKVKPQGSEELESSKVQERVYRRRVQKPVPFRDRGYEGFQATFFEKAIPADAEQPLEVAYYVWEELLDTNGNFYIGRDSVEYRGAVNTRPYTGSIMRYYPTDAIRQRDDEMYYFVYGSDQGYYVYLFFSKNNGEGAGINTPVGYPIVIKEELSYEDFTDIKPGDAVDKVKAIDPVVQVYEYMFFEVFTWNTYAANNMREKNKPISSVHYLKDGLLKIEYDILDDTELVVKDMIFDENYDLTNMYQETYNYYILPQDLPY